MALFSSIRPSFSSFNLSQNASSSPFPRSPVILKNPVTNPPKISVSTSPHRVRPVTCNSNDPSSNGSSRIFIKGLPLSTTEGFLAKTFSCFGTVTKAKIITERSSKQSLGFAYVWFDCEEAAQLAVEDMDGKFVDGRFVAVTLARPESPTSHVSIEHACLFCNEFLGKEGLRMSQLEYIIMNFLDLLKEMRGC